MTQLFALHSAYALTTAVAALDAGLLGDDEDRVLVPFVSARVPETTVGILHDPALAGLRARFDRIEDLDELLGPLHPSAWKPEKAELPVLERLLTRAWGLDGDDLEILVQSPQVAPALTLMRLFPRARITIMGDGLMTYSPLRVKLPHTITARIGRVVHADVVPGVAPLAASPSATVVPVPAQAFRRALLEAAPEEAVEHGDGDTVLVLGQYLAALGLLSDAEEVSQQRQMIDLAARRRPSRIVFKPHPSAPPRVTDALREHARSMSVEFVEYRGGLSAEVLADRLDARTVIAGFSTALPTVQSVFGRDIDSVGTDALLRRLTPFENSNRIPATIVDVLTRADSPYGEPAQLQLLIDAVGYAMQPLVAAHLRPRAEALLRGIRSVDRDRYFSPQRLAELRLPGAPPPSLMDRALRPAGGVGRVEELRLTALGARRRIGRAWRVLRGR
ncbi:alpha-2,8-polysialyltransferase family protein [Microbacterium hydrocarbonoxydans]|uniref:alpha-2,8-polysialyltransferase family protein n=1 Tax=Microbacterium hydrocarbonoxydans TaxID=273678 RepID=UPI00203E4CC9|nr:alpha-2,8-polysialyltransferase family protein [Microbacterium hydrocarbonoxydans]MCM3779832.1 alpha-2,8-polysialyltransferase family protein [Microbacterium hydrocarbonoxydans]